MISIRLTTALMLAAVSSACTHPEPEHERPVFQVTTPARKDIELSRSYVAQVRAFQHIELRALERGYLEKMWVDEGQAVKQGQHLFQIQPAVYEAELKKARAEADFASVEFQNTKALADKKIVSPNELALAKARLEKAHAELALSRVHRGFTDLRAPFDGIVGRFRVRVGSLLSEGELLTTLSDSSKMWVYFNLTEAEYLDYRARVDRGAAPAVKLMLANGAGFAHEGKIEAIEADFNNETGTIAFRATFPNPEGLLRHGETGNVVLTRTRPNALLIAQKSTFEVLDKRYVFVVDAQKKVHARQIDIVDEVPHLFVVGGGLTEADQVLLEGISRVRDGDTIEVHPIAAEDAIAHLDVRAE